MSRDPRLYLEDIQAGCEKVLRYSAGLTFEQFTQDDMRYDAVLRNLEIIGEAAKKIPIPMRENYSDVEWRKISGFRDITAHEYFSISDSIVWDIVQNKIPTLIKQIEHILNEFTE